MATFGFIVLVLLSCLLLIGACVLFQKWRLYSANYDELVVVAALVCMAIGVSYLAYQRAPFEIAVIWKQA